MFNFDIFIFNSKLYEQDKKNNKINLDSSNNKYNTILKNVRYLYPNEVKEMFL